MNTEDLKNQILEDISRLFSDTDADESEQADALEEIAAMCEQNAEVLRDQIRQRSA